MFKIKFEYYYEISTPETMKLLWSAKKIAKVKNSEDIPHLGNIEVVLVTYNIVSGR